MGYKQTPTHRFGKSSYHQIGLVRGQFGNVPMEKWLSFLQDTGFDGWEEAAWELDLARCDTDAGAEAYARERVALARSTGWRSSPSPPTCKARPSAMSPAPRLSSLSPAKR